MTWKNLCRLPRSAGQIDLSSLLQDVVAAEEAKRIYDTLRDRPNDLLGTVFQLVIKENEWSDEYNLFQKLDSISVAVITGGHAFDVPGFHAIFRDMPQVDSYIQYEENWAADIGQVRDAYDVLLFYNMPRGEPEEKIRTVLEGLGGNGQGIFLLHHAILAYGQWPLLV